MSNVPAKQNNALFDTSKTVKTLEGLMSRVTDKDCSPETVNAACNCAARITDILRLHVDVARLRIKHGAGRGQLDE